jgi:hypothetical protein
LLGDWFGVHPTSADSPELIRARLAAAAASAAAAQSNSAPAPLWHVRLQSALDAVFAKRNSQLVFRLVWLLLVALSVSGFPSSGTGGQLWTGIVFIVALLAALALTVARVEITLMRLVLQQFDVLLSMLIGAIVLALWVWQSGRAAPAQSASATAPPEAWRAVDTLIAVNWYAAFCMLVCVDAFPSLLRGTKVSMIVLYWAGVVSMVWVNAALFFRLVCAARLCFHVCFCFTYVCVANSGCDTPFSLPSSTLTDGRRNCALARRWRRRAQRAARPM